MHHDLGSHDLLFLYSTLSVRTFWEICKICENEQVETSKHMFFECNVTTSVWWRCLQWCGMPTTMHLDCISHFFQFCGLIKCNNRQRKLWKAVWFCVIWLIWKSRNRVVFEDIYSVWCWAVSGEQIKVQSWTWINAVCKGFNCPLSGWFHDPVACVTSFTDKPCSRNTLTRLDI